MVQKIYSKMYLVSCTNTHRDVIDSVNHWMVKIQKLEYLENVKFFYEIKELLICASDDTF